jgi:hypothetical protein
MTIVNQKAPDQKSQLGSCQVHNRFHPNAYQNA